MRLPILSPKRSENQNVVPQTTETKHRIGTEFRVILNVLSIAGNCPLSHDDTSQAFSLKWCSIRTIVTLAMSCFGIFIWIAHFFDHTLNRPIGGFSFRGPSGALANHLKNSTSIDLPTKLMLQRSVKVVFATFPFTHIWNIVYGWVQCGILARFLNNWSDFDAAYWKCFSLTPSFLEHFKKKGVQSGFEEERNYFFFTMKPSNFLTSAIFCCLFVSNFIIVLAMILPSTYWALYFSFLNFSIRVVALEAMLDIKTIYMYRSLTAAFSRIATGIAHVSDASRCLTEKEVQSWRQLIQFVRGQCELVGVYQKPTQLSFLFTTLLNMTCFAFIILNLPRDDDLTVMFSISWSLLASSFLIRMIIKLWIAENVTQAESRIAKELLRIDTKLVSPTGLLQVKFTHDIIANRRSAIHFGNYVTLTRGLTLKVFGQIITYLIVMMQFVQNK